MSDPQRPTAGADEAPTSRPDRQDSADHDTVSFGRASPVGSPSSASAERLSTVTGQVPLINPIGVKSVAETTEPSVTIGAHHTQPAAGVETVFDINDLGVYYGDFRAVRGATLEIKQHEITAFIGPSGCGKTTVLRCLNRMNDFIETARVEGKVLYHGVDLYDPAVNSTEVRRRIGMVFQKPNPFPKSIFDNVAYGPRLSGIKKKSELEEIVERSLKGAALWDEVKNRLSASGLSLSGGQQQRLCIARAIAVGPEVILMDEPCSSLDPIATARIEELMQEIKKKYTIVIVTHNMQQAARVSDRTAFFITEINPESDRRTGLLVEYSPTEKIFSNPDDERTEQYVTGRFG